jgi:cell wall-associated NlpC family hydrolase
LSFDPRITPARADLAGEHLRGKVEAQRFAEGTVQEVIAGIVPIRKLPAHDAPLVTEALYGERVTIYETDEEGWAWGQLKSDGYVGYLPAASLLTPKGQPTHKVGALRTFMLPGPSVKLPPMDALPLGARVAVARQEESFAVTLAGGYVPRRHLVPLAANEIDFVAVAERFIGTPYLWGGKSVLDCSGLTQVAITACGLACPRDSDMQEAAIGAPANLAEIRRGDLLFWKGHVAIARSATSLVHANAFHMAVAIEPVAEAIARISAGGSELTSVRRPK